MGLFTKDAKETTADNQQKPAENITNENKNDGKHTNYNFLAYEKKEWGYDLYPERRGEYKPKLGRVFLGLDGRESSDKFKCERNVYYCVKNSPLVKLMMGCLKIFRACHRLTPAYDPELNQIVVCQNMARREGSDEGDDSGEADAETVATTTTTEATVEADAGAAADAEV